MALMEQDAKRRGCLFYWSKVQSAAHRGEPDVSLRVTLPRLAGPVSVPMSLSGQVERTTVYGPDAHVEFKRGSNWPTKAQAVRAAGMATCGVPVYLIQLLSKESAKVWKWPIEDALKHIFHKDDYHYWLYPVTSGTWLETATILVDYISRK